MAQSTGNLPNTSPPWIGVPRSRAPFYVLLAGLLALVAGVLTFRFLGDLQRQALPTEPVVVAGWSYKPGEQITAAGVRIAHVPAVIIPDGALTDPSAAVGSPLVLPVANGEIILERDIAGDRGGALAARLPDGQWAMALPVSWMVGPVYGLEQGDSLDVLGYQAGQPAGQAGAIVQSLQVLVPPEPNSNLIVVGVTEAEAVALLYARANGFSLLGLLRPKADD